MSFSLARQQGPPMKEDDDHDDDHLHAYKRDSVHRVLHVVDSSGRLWGRDLDLDRLRSLVLINNNENESSSSPRRRRRRIVWVRGPAGSGKSALCRAALLPAATTTAVSDNPPDATTTTTSVAPADDDRNNTREPGSFVIEGKYEQFAESNNKPYSALIAAFDQLGALVRQQQRRDKEDERMMRACFQYEATLLAQLVPSLAVYDGTDDDGDGDDDADSSQPVVPASNGEQNHGGFATQRLAVAVRSFLRQFTINMGPLVLVLDDLQWADPYSQEIIDSLVLDDQLNNFVLVGVFRDDTPELVQSFLDLGARDDLEHVVTDVPIQDLALDAVNGFLASVLSHTPETTLPLAEVIHHKTAGNVNCVIQVLSKLNAQQILSYNFLTLSWEWNVEDAKAGTDVTDNVVDVIASRIRGVPELQQRILMLAACLGFVVDVPLLFQVHSNLGRSGTSDGGSALFPVSSGDSKQSPGETSGQIPSRLLQGDACDELQAFETALKGAEEDGFVERTGSKVKFCHDTIHQGFYHMIGSARSRQRLHYEIGRCLGASKNSSDPVQLLAVQQLNRGSSVIATDEERIALIKLNYKALEAAKHQAGVEAMSQLLHNAIDLVQPPGFFWNFHYEFVLDIFAACAEVDFSLGKLDEAKACIAEIMSCAVREIDKVRAMVVEFQIYGIQCEYRKAIAHGGRVLKLLGEPVPKKVTLLHVAVEYFKARKEAKNKPDDFFTNLPSTESVNTKIILRILQVGSVYGWNGDVNFAGFAMLRGFRVCLREGSSDSTPYLYCGYGFMLGLFGEYDEAFRFGQLAQRTRKTKETFPSAINLHHTMLSHLQLPVGIGLEPLLSAYRVGLETGDLFYGTICLACYVLVYWHCGLPLKPFSLDMRNFGEQLSICHQDLQLAWLVSARQLALNLMGESDDPVGFSREAIRRHNKDLFSDNLFLGLDDSSSRVVNADILFTWYLQLYNAYILEDVKIVERTMKRLLKLKNVSRRFGGTHCTNYFLPFIDGLVGLFLSKTKPETKTGPIVTRAAIAELTKMSKTRPVNTIASLDLLLAEVYARKRSTTDAAAREKYNKAISNFSRSGLNHFCAMANELAGKNMLERHETDWAHDYLRNAVQKWNEYGAVVKCRSLMQQYTFLDSTAMNLQSIILQRNIRGRARFNILTDKAPSSREFSEHFATEEAG